MSPWLESGLSTQLSPAFAGKKPEQLEMGLKKWARCYAVQRTRAGGSAPRPKHLGMLGTAAVLRPSGGCLAASDDAV